MGIAWEQKDIDIFLWEPGEFDGNKRILMGYWWEQGEFDGNKRILMGY
jgi:hypothetical protein